MQRLQGLVGPTSVWEGQLTDGQPTCDARGAAVFFHIKRPLFSEKRWGYIKLSPVLWRALLMENNRLIVLKRVFNK